jgi:tetratricopeptide (TPR) repeat protein
VFKADRANFRLVLQHAIDAERSDNALALTASLSGIWSETGQIQDSYSLARAAIALDGGSPINRARALERTAHTAMELREYSEAERFLEEADQLATYAGDSRVRYEVLNERSNLAARTGDYETAAIWAKRATQAVQELNSELLELRALRMELQIMRVRAMDQPNPDRAELKRCLAIAEDLYKRSRPAGLGNLIEYELASLYFGLGRYTESLRLEQHFLRVQDSESRYTMFSLLYIAFHAARTGNHTQAVTLATAARTRWEQDGYEPDQEDSRNLAELETAARAALGSEAYEQAIRSGQNLPFTDALEQALALELTD